MTIPGHSVRQCSVIFTTATGARSAPKIFMNNHQVDCSFRILVLGKVSADAMARFGINYHNSVSPGNLRSSTPSSVLTWLWVPLSVNPVFAYQILLFLQTAPESQHGNADINVPFYPDNNPYFAVHEYSGFELGDAGRLQTIRSFITDRSGRWCSDLERLHAIW